MFFPVTWPCGRGKVKHTSGHEIHTHQVWYRYIIFLKKISIYGSFCVAFLTATIWQNTLCLIFCPLFCMGQGLKKCHRHVPLARPNTTWHRHHSDAGAKGGWGSQKWHRLYRWHRLYKWHRLHYVAEQSFLVGRTVAHK